MVDAGQHQAQYSLLLLEPDNYQRILHEIGLNGADGLLASIANSLREALATELTAGAQIARFSENSFAVLARGEVTPAMAAGRLAEMERAAINAAVASAQGNLSMAARNLGISRSTLYVKLAAMRNVPSEGSLASQ